MLRSAPRLPLGPLHGSVLCAFVVSASLLAASPVSAETQRVQPLPSSSDGVYGRFEGDVDWAIAAGAESWSKQGRATLRLSAHYFYMAGVYASYGRAWTEASSPQQHSDVAVVGIDMRPSFLPRWSLDLERGPAFVDLMLDSLSLAAGVYWAKLQAVSPWGSAATGSNDWTRGFEASLGVGLPLLARATGPWLELRAGGRWNNGHRATDDPWGVQVLVSWHQLWQSSIPAVR